MQKITVGIVEDNPQLGQDILEKLALSEDIKVLFEVRNGKELLKTLESGTIPQVLLMDISMPEMNGIEATRRAKQQCPNLKIVMLTVMDDEQKLFQAFQVGAMGYMLKDTKPYQLLNGITEVLEGGLPLSPSMAGRVFKYLIGEKSIPRPPMENAGNLTKREMEILELSMAGITIKQVAEKLFISDKTVRKHLENIYEKLQVHSYKELIFKINSKG